MEKSAWTWKITIAHDGGNSWSVNLMPLNCTKGQPNLPCDIGSKCVLYICYGAHQCQGWNGVRVTDKKQRMYLNGSVWILGGFPLNIVIFFLVLVRLQLFVITGNDLFYRACHIKKRYFPIWPPRTHKTVYSSVCLLTKHYGRIC